MTIDIKRSAATILSPAIDQGTPLHKSLNGDEYINAVFSLDSFTEILIGDYITFRGATYTVRQTPDIKKVSEAEYQYTVRFDGPRYLLEDAMYLMDGDMEFYLTGTAEDFIDLIVENMNRVFGTGEYLTGSVTSTDFKVLHFNGENCLKVLQRICQEFELEYYLSGDPVSINLSEAIGNATGLEFEYKSGLYNIKRTKVQNKNVITRLYPFGSEKNLGPDYTDRRTRTPLGSKLRLKYSTHPDNYIEENVATYGLKEATREFPDIYPHFTGAVETTSDSQHIVDTSIDFDLNFYLIEGVTAKVVFLSGDLSGYEFEIISFNNSTKEVYFKTYTDEQGGEWPSGSFVPAIGDQFTFVDIKMPPAYISAAEAELLSEATAYLNQASAPSMIYEIEMDWHSLKASATDLDIGDVITIVDSELAPGGVDLRIVELTQQLANVYKYTVKISDDILKNYFAKTSNDRSQLLNYINTAKYTAIIRTPGNLARLNRDDLQYEDGADVTSANTAAGIAGQDTSVTFNALAVTADASVGGDLDVTGDGGFAGDVRIRTNSDLMFDYSHMQTDVGIKWWGSDSVETYRAGIVSIDEDNYRRVGIGFYTSDAADYTTPAELRMSILKNGNVGIGTTTPNVGLELMRKQLSLNYSTSYNVSSKYNSQGVLWSTESTLPSVIFNGNATQRPEISWNRGGRIYPEFTIRQHATSDRGGTIYSGSGLVAPTATMSFYSANVGIGTTTPTAGYKLDVNGNEIVQGDLDVSADITVGVDIGSPVFTSGFAGSGWQYDDSETRLTIDNLTVRKQLRVYELLIEQIRANRGAIVVSPGNAKILSNVAGTVTVDTGDDDRFPMSIVYHDLLRCQRWNGSGTKYYVARVDSVTGDTFTYTIVGGTDDIEEGDEVVVFGSVSNADRQGLVYITASDDEAPYIDVLDGVNTASLTGKTKVRLGKLDGITDTDAGLDGTQSDEYGLYSENVHLKGHIFAPSGEIGGWTIDSDSIETDDGAGTRMLLKNTVATSGFYGRSLTLYRDDGATPVGEVKIVGLGQVRVKDSTTFSATEEYGLEVVKRTSTGYKHVIRIAGSEALIAGWTIDNDAIYTGTKKTTDGYATSGITLSANGSIHAESFYVDSDGDVAFKNINEATFKTDVDNYGIKISGGHIWENDLDGHGWVLINYKGYNGGTTQYRSTVIGDGKGDQMWYVNPDPAAEGFGINHWIETRINADIVYPKETWDGVGTIEVMGQYTQQYLFYGTNSGKEVRLYASPYEGQEVKFRNSSSQTVTLGGNGNNIYWTSSAASHSVATMKGLHLVFLNSNWHVVGDA